jgi:ankyrin repeat protein
MKKLLLLSAIIFSTSVFAQTDVFSAARSGDTKAIAQLYALNADTINAENQQGYTPLILACYYNQTAVLELLMQYKVALNETPNSPTALQAASYKGFKDCVKLLLDYGANPNIVDANGTSPLIYAVQFNHTEIVGLLLKKGASVTYKDPNGFTAINYAENLGLTEILAMLKSN